MVSAASIIPSLETAASNLKTASFEKVIQHSYYFWEKNSINRTSISKDIINQAINSIKMRQPKFDEFSLDGQINLVRQELRTMYPDKNVY